VRADAARNRAKIVDAAREVFREQGYDASLDEVAKRAGVGPGTLYRHFPTRDNLVDAVMQAWVDRVNSAVETVLTGGGDAREMLLRWLETYVGLITVHKGGAARITGALDDETSPIQTKCQVLRGATQQVIDKLGGDLRPDVDSLQMARLAGGVATVADSGDLPAPAVRPMLAVIADGLLR
jgi:AcrR family transcriptional regulator